MTFSHLPALAYLVALELDDLKKPQKWKSVLEDFPLLDTVIAGLKVEKVALE